MVEFAGYSMPVQYKSIIAEAQAVRNHAGMFDVSHMARLTLTGPKTLEFLEWVTTNDVAKLTNNQGQYSMLPNANGGIVDDIIVYKINDNTYKLVVNASNHAKDVAHLNAQNTFDVQIQDETAQTAMIAVQGPKASEIVANLSDHPESLKDMPFFAVVDTKIANVPCFAAKSGYTGEDGFELVCPADQAESLWNALHQAGVEPCGLGSRDTLRVEAGLPLYGHELTDDLSPLTAGLGWVISKTKTFLGSNHINKVREQGPSHKLQGVLMQSKRIPPIDAQVFITNSHGDQSPVGKISSGVYSPLFEQGIAFAFIDPSIKLNTPCTVEIRGKQEPATIVSKRFLQNK